MAPEMAAGSALEGVMSGRAPEAVDRAMIGVCGAIWLGFLAAQVFAFVAFFRLATGRTGGGEQQSSWVLYSIIVVSALVIAGAIPLLLRARRNALAGSHQAGLEADVAVEPAPPAGASTEKIRVFGVDPYARRQAEQAAVSPILERIVERMWLRGTVSLLSAVGLALTAVAVGGYLLAESSDTAAWVAFGLAGVITVAMPAILAYFQRQLGEAVEEIAA